MSVASNLVASWAAFGLAGMLTAATWTASGGSAVPGEVFFDAPGSEVIDGVFSTEPSVRFRVADWPNVREGSAVTIGSTTYKVRDVQPLDDGLLARAFLTTRA